VQPTIFYEVHGRAREWTVESFVAGEEVLEDMKAKRSASSLCARRLGGSPRYIEFAVFPLSHVKRLICTVLSLDVVLSPRSKSVLARTPNLGPMDLIYAIRYDFIPF
jgi:hypothetical protein